MKVKKNGEKNLTTVHFFTISRSNDVHQHKTIIQCDYSIQYDFFKWTYVHLV
jgi:hypothetical protein